jgi:phosphoribosyl 1,2-cyclic phosphodiesterase
MDLKRRLTRYLSAPLFPVHLRELPSRCSFHDTPLESFEVDGMGVEAGLVIHPGPTLAYRLTDGGRALAYMPDHEPILGDAALPEVPAWTSGFALAQDADVLIHDSQYSEFEYRSRVGWGHCPLPLTFEFAQRTNVERLVTFHHDPDHSDHALDLLHHAAMEGQHFDFEIMRGIEGLTLDV